MRETDWMEGGCHCGRVRFACDPGGVPELLDCNCSICAKSGFLHLIVPAHRFRLLCGKVELTSYRFGTGTAVHLFCRTCGVKSFYRPRSHPDAFSVNARCLDTRLDATVRSFDGRNWEQSRTALG
ncbi:MAG: GFA family protein [Sphingomonadaceae bacterium]|nr:GFA family protein [Sphingomonadaceae bacterium]